MGYAFPVSGLAVFACVQVALDTTFAAVPVQGDAKALRVEPVALGAV